ncbi:MAG: acetyltransferase [Verrucomicrobiales bacterium]|nr:acetyltransferase [Verrucomicrobiales bacterium]
MNVNSVKQVLVVGASGFGREMLVWSRHAGFDKGEYRIKGFLDDNPGALNGHESLGLRVVGSIADYVPEPEDRFVCGISLPWVKKKCVERLLGRGAQFLTVIHPSAILGPNVDLGVGCVICPGVVLTMDIVLGDFVTINCCSSMGHDARVGDWCSLNGHCDVTGGVVLGEGVLMGSHASVIPGMTVEDWAIVGAGTVACARVATGTTVFGVPARVLWRSGPQTQNTER